MPAERVAPAMDDDLDAETLVTLSVLGEIEHQCAWALGQLAVVRNRLPKVQGGPMITEADRKAWFRARFELFGAIQAYLTCAGIADSLLTGKGPPPPRGRLGLSEEQRQRIQGHLRLPDGFEIGGRPQRNSLVHIEERLIPWSRPGGMRGDFAVLSIDRQHPEVLAQTLRVLDPSTLDFAVVGERCNLTEVEQSLRDLLTSAVAAHTRILDEVNARERSEAESGPNSH
jgi:hypothetical protein